MLAYLCPVGQSQSELQVNSAYFKNEYSKVQYVIYFQNSSRGLISHFSFPGTSSDGFEAVKPLL